MSLKGTNDLAYFAFASLTQKKSFTPLTQYCKTDNAFAICCSDNDNSSNNNIENIEIEKHSSLLQNNKYCKGVQ
jgi:hypothetical protein